MTDQANIKQIIEAIASDDFCASRFLPRGLGYQECVDLDGTHARKFLEAAGFTVVENSDTGRHGFARTECGIVLSTNGYIHRAR